MRVGRGGLRSASTLDTKPSDRPLPGDSIAAVKLTERVHLVGSGEPDLLPTDPLDSQVYLLRTDVGLVCIDAGSGLSVERILGNVVADELDPSAIGWLFLTHTHADHAGAGTWKERLPDVRVAVSWEVADWLRRGDEEAISLDRARRAGMYPTDFHIRPCDVDIELRDGDVFEFGDLRLEVVATPGHCTGHLSFVLHETTGRTLFSGDALFPGGRILLQDVWDCDLQATLRSVERLAATAPDHLMAGHLHPVIGAAAEHMRIATDRIAALAVPPSLF